MSERCICPCRTSYQSCCRLGPVVVIPRTACAFRAMEQVLYISDGVGAIGSEMSLSSRSEVLHVDVFDMWSRVLYPSRCGKCVTLRCRAARQG